MCNSYPTLVVFDLDDCTWSPETCFLSGPPNKNKIQTGPLLNNKGNGTTGVLCGNDYLTVHPGAMTAFQEIYENKKYPNMRLALASSASNYGGRGSGCPADIGFRALEILEILPNVTIRDVINKSWESHPNYSNIIKNDFHCLIGNSGILSEDKSKSHFPLLRKNLEIEYDQMLFFDDSNWTNHCRLVSQKCGVVCQRTPHGCQVQEWNKGVQDWKNKYGVI